MRASQKAGPRSTETNAAAGSRSVVAENHKSKLSAEGDTQKRLAFSEASTQAQPSRRAVARLRERVRGILRPGNQAPWPEVVREVNRVVGGWQRYFSYGTVSRAYWNLDKFLLSRARGFLMRRHKLPGRGTRRFTAEQVFERDVGLRRRPQGCDGTHPRPVAAAPTFDSTG